MKYFHSSQTLRKLPPIGMSLFFVCFVMRHFMRHCYKYHHIKESQHHTESGTYLNSQSRSLFYHEVLPLITNPEETTSHRYVVIFCMLCYAAFYAALLQISSYQRVTTSHRIGYLFKFTIKESILP